MAKTTAMIPLERIQRGIQEIRGQRVMLDVDLADLYGVETRALVQAVKRNRRRFPGNFMLQLSALEVANLKSQFVISSSWGGRRRSRPYAFTEQGIAMLSSVLRSDRAVRVNILIMRAFVRLRQVIAANSNLASKLDALESKSKEHDLQIAAVFQAIRKLMFPPAPLRREPIGFRSTRSRRR